MDENELTDLERRRRARRGGDMRRVVEEEDEAADEEQEVEEVEEMDERWLREPRVGSWWSLSTGLRDGERRLGSWSGDTPAERREEQVEEGVLVVVAELLSMVATEDGMLSQGSRTVGSSRPSTNRGSPAADSAYKRDAS